ncbi:hypothetical protein NDU88_007750 [Pleurodeles waltl]|uniref:Uncharacterized protein n=1 Tax=Pleurodeles waltl TaxID=8319 RepID=A0AAV7STD3_PLEWA|nr:hypothetical protein NDU88_007750 [Pleurodeles waltl]
MPLSLRMRSVPWTPVIGMDSEWCSIPGHAQWLEVFIGFRSSSPVLSGSAQDPAFTLDPCKRSPETKAVSFAGDEPGSQEVNPVISTSWENMSILHLCPLILSVYALH